MVDQPSRTKHTIPQGNGSWLDDDTSVISGSNTNTDPPSAATKSGSATSSTLVVFVHDDPVPDVDHAPAVATP